MNGKSLNAINTLYLLQNKNYNIRGIGGSSVALKKYCVGAEVGEGLAIHGAEAVNPKAEVDAWAKRNL